MKEQIEKRMDIAKRFAEHLADPAKENEELDALFQEKPELRELFDDIAARANTVNWNPTGKQEWSDFQKKFLSPRVHRRNLILRYVAAACVVVTTSVALSLFFTRVETTPREGLTLSDNLPTLSVSDEVYTLDSEGFKNVNRQTHTTIRQTTTGLTYVSDTATPAKPEWHTIQVPQQAEFTLTLADGSRVRLNANTRLRYPVPFTGSTREIWVEGEAFFEVTPNKEKPFTVHFEENSVTVLGTSFNVSCYKDTPSRTTLVSGSVRLRNPFDSIVLVPGQEGIITPDEKNITVREADIKVATAWLNDRFYFKELPLARIMEVLGEWYGLEIQFNDDGLRDLLFSVETKRYGEIDSVLQVIEGTGKVHFTKKNNIIEIKKQE